jgi:hypothetical protein
MFEHEDWTDTSAAMKLFRAHEHLDSIDAEIHAFFEPAPYVLAPESNTETGERLRRIVATDKPPIELSLMIGDALHNLRSALDHLVWERSAPHARDAKTGFPLSLTRQGFSSSQHRLRGLSADDRAIIERLQPYHASDELEARTEPLRVLHDLNIADKHQFLHLTWLSLESATLVTNARGGNIVHSETFHGPVEDGTVLARVLVSPPDAEVDMHFGAAFDVALGSGTTPWGDLPVGHTLAILRGAVEDAIQRFSWPP